MFFGINNVVLTSYRSPLQQWDLPFKIDARQQRLWSYMLV